MVCDDWSEIFRRLKRAAGMAEADLASVGDPSHPAPLDTVSADTASPDEHVSPAAGRRVVAVAHEQWVLGVREPDSTGPNGRAIIQDYIRAGLGWGDSYERNGDFQWCGAFGVGYCWGAVGLRADIRKAYGSSCYRLVERWAKGTTRLIDSADARPGDIVIVGPPSGRSWGAHITVAASEPYADDNGQWVIDTYEGNAKGEGPNGERFEGVIRRGRPYPGGDLSPNEYRVMHVIRPLVGDLDAMVQGDDA